MGEPHTIGAQWVDLLEYYRQTTQDKKKSHRADYHRVAGRKTPALLLDGLHPPHRQADKPVSAVGAR